MALFGGFILLLPPASYGQGKNTCLDCHAVLPPPLEVAQEQFARDIHAEKGLNCASCHGGDPSNEDPLEAMSRAAGFRGKVRRAQIPALCGSCHSDAAYMRRFNPSLRTDQLAQYRTSGHGRGLARGDTKVAVCTDCHSIHGIRPASDTRSSVHPLRVAETCARCHSSAEHMKGYRLPTDQFAAYTASVHHEALVQRGDLSAPTCSTCHGNHGAAPPGVASVEFVCSTCHVFQMKLFDASPHRAPFAAAGFPGCVTCHGNHRIARPSDEMLGTGRDSVCLNCHSPGDAGYQAAATMHEQLKQLESAIARAQEILDRAERSGMEVGESRLEQAQARDGLTKARVTIHSFTLARVQQDIQAGMQVAEKTYQAGLAALEERDYRRRGLAVSLVSILIVLIGLWLYLRKLESRAAGGATG